MILSKLDIKFLFRKNLNKQLCKIFGHNYENITDDIRPKYMCLKCFKYIGNNKNIIRKKKIETIL